MHKRLIPLLLAYVNEENPIDGRTRLQKMVFVLQQQLKEAGEYSDSELYSFFAYDYGPFSKELAESIDTMIEQGLLAEHPEEYNEEGDLKYLYELEPEGKELIEQALDQEVLQGILDAAAQLKTRYNEDLTLPEVIDEVYDDYPEFAENSIYD